MAAKMQRASEKADLREIVLSEIRQQRELADADVNIAADRDVLTLTGVVHSDAERIAVETVARQVPGVRAIADDLDVKPSRARSGTDVAKDVVKALRSHIFLSAEHITAVVRNGGVALEGEVHSELQRMLAEAEVKRLRGVFGIANHIEVNPEAFAGGAQSQASEEASLQQPVSFDDADWVDTGNGEPG